MEKEITNKMMLASVTDIIRRVDEVQPFVLNKRQSFEVKFSTGENYYIGFIHWQHSDEDKRVSVEQIASFYVWPHDSLKQVINIMDYLNKIEEDSF